MTAYPVRAWAASLRADADHIHPDGPRHPDIDRLEPDERARYRRYCADLFDRCADEIDREETPVAYEGNGHGSTKLDNVTKPRRTAIQPGLLTPTERGW